MLMHLFTATAFALLTHHQSICFIQRPTYLYSSSGNGDDNRNDNVNDTIKEVKPSWVGIASTNRVLDSHSCAERNGETVSVSASVQVQTTDDGIDRTSCLLLHHETENEICFDLSSPREWLEYNEMKDGGICGAYTVLRCDLYSDSVSGDEIDRGNDANDSDGQDQVRLWGKEFHFKRISNSFMQMISCNQEEKQSHSKEYYQPMLDQALLESEKVLGALIQKATISCSNGIEKNDEESNNNTFKILMLTLLWTPKSFTNDQGREVSSIKVRGHAYCSNINFNPASYDPQPITASVALPVISDTIECDLQASAVAAHTSLPSRYDKNPAAKLSSWCRIRRPLEKLYKGQESDGVAEVLLARKLKPETSDGEDSNWTLLEGLTSNLFIVYRDGSIHTNCVENDDHGGVLGGYSRHLILEAAKRHNIPIVLGPLSMDDGRNGLWAEAFVSSSIRLIVPLGRIVTPNSGQIHDVGDSFSRMKHDKGQQPFQLEEFWSETPLSLLPWKERKWISLYQYLNVH